MKDNIQKIVSADISTYAQVLNQLQKIDPEFEEMFDEAKIAREKSIGLSVYTKEEILNILAKELLEKKNLKIAGDGLNTVMNVNIFRKIFDIKTTKKDIFLAPVSNKR